MPLKNKISIEILKKGLSQNVVVENFNSNEKYIYTIKRFSDKHNLKFSFFEISSIFDIINKFIQKINKVNQIRTT